ncbi:mucin-2 isoform X2 [Plodia interpunctella]|nr:mucin-5AC isoform X2 [Plodia interpunctella]
MDLLTWTALVLAVFTFATPALSSEPRVVCYYTNWSVYRPGTAKFNPQNINPYLCTHLVYAFGGFTTENALKPFDKYQDIEKGGYAKFNGLKTYNKNLKTLLAIGGWNEGSSRFSPMVASKERRKEFVRNAIKFLRQNHFDGLDLDWEYPASRDGSKPKDRENYAKLVKELREEFEKESQKTGKSRLLLTMAVPAGISYIKKGFDVKTLNKYLDWMNLLTYDYHSAFEPAVNHHAPLYPLEEPNEYSDDSELTIDYTIKYYLENGADAHKLVLGIPTYGRSYTLFNPDAFEIGAPADGPGEQGEATREKGYLAYYEICEYLKPKERKRSVANEEEESEEDSEEEEEEEEWTVMYPNPKAMGPVAYRGNQWVGYDDIEIVKRKAEYVAENGLGGIMFWSIDNDDFRGTCHGKPYPLIEAAKEAYILKTGATDNAIVTEKPQPSRTSSRRRNRPRTSTTTTTTTLKPTAAKTLSSKRKSSVTSTTPSWNIITPEPPTTPDPGSDFKCKDEGFFPHPRDCKKYFWCLDSGPSNLGIVAHQFTCPSGLFFNKAADSCDFARNVLCKKPSATTKAPPKAPSSSTTTTTTTTTRRPIKLSTKNSVLFRTTTTTTTTPEPEVEEEDEVHDDAADIEAEDPKVIKELIDLIKKVGGVEQLEKHLKLSGGSQPADGATTTPSSLNKKLYKVLERTRGKSRFGNSILEEASSGNSRRGPQNAGLAPADDRDALLKKDRPQYTTINRSRQQTTAQPEEQEDESEQEAEVDSRPVSRARVAEQDGTTSKTLQYVNIRRARPTYNTDTADDTASRNALFERAEPYVAGALDVSARRENMPEYVTIRRQRPTTEETTTVQYHNTDLEEDSQGTALEREISAQPQYTSIVRARSTTLSPSEGLVNPEPTTVLAVQISSLLNSPSPTEAQTLENETEALITETEPTSTTTTTSTSTTTTTELPTAASSVTPRQIGFRRRGSTTTTPYTTTQGSKDRRLNFLRRTKSTTIPTVPDTEPDTDVEATTAKSRRGPSRFKSRTSDTKERETEQPSLKNARRNELPRRNYLRRRPGGDVTTTSSPPPAPVSSTLAALAARRPFRVSSRRRPIINATTTTTTAKPAPTENSDEDFLQDVEDYDYEDPDMKTRIASKAPKTPRRPLVTLKEEDQNPSATNEEENKRHSKKYSSTFKKNQFENDLNVRDEEDSTEKRTTVYEFDEISPETAVAIAAHQLLSAPVPVIPSYDEDTTPTRKSTTSPKTVTEFEFTSPQYTETYNKVDSKTYKDDYKTTVVPSPENPERSFAQGSTGPEYSVLPLDFDTLRTTSFAPKTTYSTAFPQSVDSEPTITHIGLTGTRYPLKNTEYTTAEFTGPTASNAEVPKITYPEPTSFAPKSPFRQFPKDTFITKAEATGPTAVNLDLPANKYPEAPSTSYIPKSTFRTTLQSKPTGFSLPDLRGTTFTASTFAPKTSRPINSRVSGSSPKLIPVPVEDYAFTTNTYSGLGQEPAYFTREYLLESPVTKAYDEQYQYILPTTTTTSQPPRKIIRKKHRKISTTLKPTTEAYVPVVTTAKPRRVSTVKPFEKVQKTAPNRTYRPILNYDYYDDGQEKVAEKYVEGTKVVVHAKGNIECLDIGNFPHPTSCKKFISCARMESGALLGWEYVCPKGLSFDPVGGICNWSAGLGCVEKDA